MESRVELKFLIDYEDYVHLSRKFSLFMDNAPNSTRDNGYIL